MKKRKKISIIIFIIAILIIGIILYSMRYTFLQEDILFFQFFNSIISSNNNKNKEEIETQTLVEENAKQSNFKIWQVQFKVQARVTQNQMLNLFQTISPKTVVNEKIAPGTNGNFEIVLNSEETLNYKITFESQNEKPSNMQFYIEENKKYATLEELDDILKGRIDKKEERKIRINWEWCYETNEEANKQDTIEAKRIREYHFLIYVKGY